MKQIILAGTLGLAASASLAGGLSDPVVTPDVVIDATVESAGTDDWVIALMTFITIGWALGR